MENPQNMLRCSKDDQNPPSATRSADLVVGGFQPPDHDAITAFAKKHGINFDSAEHSASNNSGKLRCWKDDYKAVEEFCEKYGLCYGEIVYDGSRYNVFFTDSDGDEVECCLSKNTGDLRKEPSVKYTDIVLYIPLNERDLKTDVCAKLMEYCLANDVIRYINV